MASKVIDLKSHNCKHYGMFTLNAARLSVIKNQSYTKMSRNGSFLKSF